MADNSYCVNVYMGGDGLLSGNHNLPADFPIGFMDLGSSQVIERISEMVHGINRWSRLERMTITSRVPKHLAASDSALYYAQLFELKEAIRRRFPKMIVY